jgi:hypothetical protein
LPPAGSAERIATLVAAGTAAGPGRRGWSGGVHLKEPTMTNAPRPVVIFVPLEIGSPEPLRRIKPVYPKQRRDAPWPRRQAIPPLDRDELRRRVHETLRATRREREAMREMGLRLLAA